MIRSLLACLLTVFCFAQTGPSVRAADEPLPFQAAAEGWSAINAHALAVASDIAYEKDPEKLKAAIKTRLGLEDVVPFAWSTPSFIGKGEGGTQGFIAASDDAILLVFRGTEPNPVDFLTDAWFRPVSLESRLTAVRAPGRVHEGFATALQVVWSDVQRELGAAIKRHPQAKLWLGGHSLGGALAFTATSALLHIENAPLRPQGVIAFGSPVTGDAAFCEDLAKSLPARVYRCVCSFDLVGEDILAQSLAVAVSDAFDSWLPCWSWDVPGRLVYFDAKGRAHTSVNLLLQTTEMVAFVRSLDIHRKDFTDKDRAMEKLRNSAEKLAARHNIGNTYVPALRSFAADTAAGKAKALEW